ncbi:MAG: hypothetical protein H6605_04120 [Flavobacteriales bacterium]|nr:hypothetical protein [Flavobacteriales bacterium]
MKKALIRISLLSFFLVFAQVDLKAQQKKILFIGNSYIFVNDLPDILKKLALSGGDSVLVKSVAPGGFSLKDHVKHSETTQSIVSEKWDFVVLQEQSQKPALAQQVVDKDVYPYAKQLDSLIHLNSPCTKTVFYMTWGRKFGDSAHCASWPPVCTYSGMDSLLKVRYLHMAVENNAMVSPVSVVWRTLIDQDPEIELYQKDNSHPTYAGSFAAACSFYATFFQKDPSLLKFSGKLDPAIALTIKKAASSISYERYRSWDLNGKKLHSDFTYTYLGNNEVQFHNLSRHATKYEWTLEDQKIRNIHPFYEFRDTGIKTIRLISFNACESKEAEKNIYVGVAKINHGFTIESKMFYPNPANRKIYFDNNPGYDTLTIFDTYGKKYIRILQFTEPVLDVSLLPENSYMIICHREKEIFMQRLQIRR